MHLILEPHSKRIKSDSFLNLRLPSSIKTRRALNLSKSARGKNMRMLENDSGVLGVVTGAPSCLGRQAVAEGQGAYEHVS